MKKINPKIAAIVISLLVITIAVVFRFFPKAFSSDQMKGFSETGIAAFMVAVVFIIGKRGFQSAKSGNVSAIALWTHVSIGSVCLALAEAMPILGLGGLFMFYGLAGLIAIGLKKISSRRNQ